MIDPALWETMGDHVERGVKAGVHQAFGPVLDRGLLEKLDRFLSKQGSNFTVYPYAVGASEAVRVLERDPSRIRAMIYNLGPNRIYLAGQQAVTVGGPGQVAGGWPLDPDGPPLVLEDVVAGLWAIGSDPSSDADVRVLDFSNGI